MNNDANTCPFKQGRVTINKDAKVHTLVWIGKPWQQYDTEHLLYILGYNTGIREVRMVRLLESKTNG